MGGGASKKNDAKVAVIKPESPVRAVPAAPPTPTPTPSTVPKSPTVAATPASPAKPSPVEENQDSIKEMSPQPMPTPAAPTDPSQSSPADQAGPLPVDATANTSSLPKLSDEEFTRIVGETFGPMVATALVSTKWDRKVEALKNVTEVLKRKLVQPSQLATQTERQRINSTNKDCFRAVCLVLERSTCDKILPVLLASHELVRAAFQQAGSIIPEDELRASLDSLLANVWPKVGDSNIRLHDSAKATIIFAAGLSFYKLPVVLERLQGLISEKTRGHMRAKQISGVVDTVCSLVEQFPGQDQLCVISISMPKDAQMWAIEQISPFIQSGLDDVVGPRTRIGAVKLAGIAFSKLGREAMNPLLESLRPAVRNLVLQKFDELEGLDDEPEIEDVHDVEQTLIKQPSAPRPPTGSKRPTTGSKRPTTGGARPVTSQKPPLAKSKEVKAPSIPKPSQSGAANIKVPASPKAPLGPSPRQKRFTPSSQEQCSEKQQKWASDMSVLEEDIMDQILEETGLVFGKGEKLTVGLEQEMQEFGLRGAAISCY